MDNVFVDTAEPKHILNEFEEQIFSNKHFINLNIIRKQLYASDMMYKSLGAERKEINDFIASIHEYRLSNQVIKMNLNFTHKYLLVVGDISEFNDVDWKGIYTKIADLELRDNFKVMFFYNDRMLVHYFLMLCSKLDKELKPFTEFRIHKPDTKNEQIGMLTAVFKCGKKSAIKLLKKHKTIKNVVNLPNSSKKKLHKHMYHVFNKEYIEDE